MGALEAVSEVVKKQKALEGDLRRKVKTARVRHATWAQIGAALGVSGSAAHQRFGDIVSEPTRRSRGGSVARALPESVDVS